MENSYILAILFALFCLSGGDDVMQCSKGEKLHTPSVGHDVCIVCDDETFMDEENHSLRTCKPCAKIENSEVEVPASDCNRTHNTKILCISGLYRRRARNVQEKDRCENCTECLFPARDCEGYYDTVCCPPNHDAVMSYNGVFVCKERPGMCRPGQFFNPHTEECLSCPDVTFMSAHNHKYRACFKCEKLSGNNDNHAVIIRSCSRTAPTLFGCEEGYFRDPRQESTQIEVPCTRCENCSLAECSMFQGCTGNKQGANAKPGLTEKTEKGVRGNSLLNDTSDNQDRVQAGNGETQFQKSVPCNITVYVAIVTLIVILMCLLYILFYMTRHNEHNKLDHSNAACSYYIKFRTIIVVACVLIVALLFCLFFHAGTIPVSDGLNAAFVGGTIAVSGIFIIALINFSWHEHRQPNKPYGKEKSTSARQLHEQHEIVTLRNDNKLLEVRRNN